MRPVVHILATCRKRELWPATVFVFRTLRVGFPTATIHVWKNGEIARESAELRKICAEDTGIIAHDCDVMHADWIERLLDSERVPFWICETDIVFWNSMEQWDLSERWMVGRKQPLFFDDYVGARTADRLHASLVYFDPAKINERLSEYWAGTLTQDLAKELFPARKLLVQPEYVPIAGKPYYYDTLAGLYHAIGGTAFTEEQLNCYDHLHCSTYSDLAAPRFTLARNIGEDHRKIFENPELARGSWRNQDKYFAHFGPGNNWGAGIKEAD